MLLVFFFFFCRFDSFVDFREDMLFVVLCVSQMSFSISPSRKTNAILLLLRSLVKSSAVDSKSLREAGIADRLVYLVADR